VRTEDAILLGEANCSCCARDLAGCGSINTGSPTAMLSLYEMLGDCWVHGRMDGELVDDHIGVNENPGPCRIPHLGSLTAVALR
jgi:hypothetical protein